MFAVRLLSLIANYYNWKAKYGGMEASDIKKIKDPEDENQHLPARNPSPLVVPERINQRWSVDFMYVH